MGIVQVQMDGIVRIQAAAPVGRGIVGNGHPRDQLFRPLSVRVGIEGNTAAILRLIPRDGAAGEAALARVKGKHTAAVISPAVFPQGPAGHREMAVVFRVNAAAVSAGCKVFDGSAPKSKASAAGYPDTPGVAAACSVQAPAPGTVLQDQTAVNQYQFRSRVSR